MRRTLTAAAAVALCTWAALTSSGAHAAGPNPSTPAPRSSAAGTGHGVNVGTVPLTTTQSGAQYLLKDPTRGDTQTVDAGTGQVLTDADNEWGDGTPANGQSAAVDAQFTGAEYWDYLKEEFGREGIRDDGVGVKSQVPYGTHQASVRWDPSCACLVHKAVDSADDLPISLDTAGHELTHGLTAVTAGLVFAGDSGALNEATSDIFGTMLEWHANVPADTPDYTIGEEYRASGPVRWMDRPSRDGQSADCWSSSLPTDVRHRSGVGNHFFYLLAEGSGAKVINGVSYDSPTCDGSTVTGIGREKAAAIWYDTLTMRMTSNTTYATARALTLSTAQARYGAGSAEYAAVSAAWSAVNVR